ncbi:MAG: putative N-acetyltransferase (TIGR04045 family) [Crocinitomicaceae bacterium]|jgi:putative N-acetyltransferase (TIGR04045 family)
MYQNSHQSYSDFTVKWATLDWEIEQAYALRKRVFCGEQDIFLDNDLDEIDDHAQVLVAIANHGGWHERIVGTVRIHQQEADLWWGSRLAVEHAFRHQVGLGSELIRLAVSSAHALGCETFLAQVQKQNETLFQKLNWESCYDLMVRKKPHVMMKANLNAYPPCYKPNSGFVLKAQQNRCLLEPLSPLLHIYDQAITEALPRAKGRQHAAR